jgi:hypothetical protein
MTRKCRSSGEFIDKYSYEKYNNNFKFLIGLKLVVKKYISY